MKMSLEKSLESFYEEFKEDADFIAEGLIVRITENISRIMKAKNINNAQLAEELGTSKAYVTKVLNGNPNMTIRTLAKIAVALGEEIIKIPLFEEKKYFYAAFEYDYNINIVSSITSIAGIAKTDDQDHVSPDYLKNFGAQA